MPQVLSQAQLQDGSVLTWSSEEILQGHNEIVITHGNEKYVLKKTKNDRLIMMK